MRQPSGAYISYSRYTVNTIITITIAAELAISITLDAESTIDPAEV
jgi:hypothetical protein